MFWIIKRIFWLGVFAALIYFAAQYKIDDKPVKEYASEFYHSPLVQAVLKTGKEMVHEFWDEKMGDGSDPAAETVREVPGSAGEELTPQDREALDRVLEKQDR